VESGLGGEAKYNFSYTIAIFNGIRKLQLLRGVLVSLPARTDIVKATEA